MGHMVHPSIVLGPIVHANANSQQPLLVAELEEGFSFMQVDDSTLLIGPQTLGEDTSCLCTEDKEDSERRHSQVKAPSTTEISYKHTLNCK